MFFSWPKQLLSPTSNMMNWKGYEHKLETPEQKGFERTMLKKDLKVMFFGSWMDRCNGGLIWIKIGCCFLKMNMPKKYWILSLNRIVDKNIYKFEKKNILTKKILALKRWRRSYCKFAFFELLLVIKGEMQWFENFYFTPMVFYVLCLCRLYSELTNSS